MLKDLQTSEGWALLKAHLEREWGPTGYGWHMQQAIEKVPPGPDRPYELARIAEQVDSTAKAMNELVLWPEERIGQLTQPQPSRRPFSRLRRVGQ